MEPMVVADTSVRVIEKVSSRVVTNKTVIQRTANTNAVQVNRYDAEGNLKSSEVDSESWEERDTQKYEWTDKDEPPVPVSSGPTPADERLERFFSAPGEDGTATQTPGSAGPVSQDALVLASSERRDVPAVCWSGTHVEEESAKDEDHKTTTKMDGLQWSRSGESVWISSSIVNKNGAAVSSPSSPPKLTILPLKATENGFVDAPILMPQVSPPVAKSTPVIPQQLQQQQQQQPTLSIEERRKKRCMESSARKSAAVPGATN